MERVQCKETLATKNSGQEGKKVAIYNCPFHTLANVRKTLHMYILLKLNDTKLHSFQNKSSTEGGLVRLKTIVKKLWNMDFNLSLCPELLNG